MLPGMFPLGAFMVEPSGKLTFRAPASSAGFSFVWRGRRFSALLGQGGVSLTGVLGQIPSSAMGGQAREAAFVALRSLPRLLPTGWTLKLTSDHRIQIKTTQEMEWPAFATDLMLPLVTFLLRLAPYMDLMDEMKLGPAGKGK